MTDYEKLMKTAEQCEIKILTDDMCCKLLAWVYVEGGYTESTIYNVKLRTDILTAQKRLNVFGSEIPNFDLCEKLKTYIKELEDNKAEWLGDFNKKYGL